MGSCGSQMGEPPSPSAHRAIAFPKKLCTGRSHGCMCAAPYSLCLSQNETFKQKSESHLTEESRATHAFSLLEFSCACTDSPQPWNWGNLSGIEGKHQLVCTWCAHGCVF